jgi:hypothetical protein
LEDGRVKSFIALVGFLMLVGCGQQQSGITEDAFEYAKKYVWGDKINGCKYQAIVFDDKFFYQQNSKNMIKNIKALDKSFRIEEFEKYPIRKVVSNRHKFHLLLDDSTEGSSFNENNFIEFTIDKEDIYISRLEHDKKSPKRNGSVYPTDLKICKDE